MPRGQGVRSSPSFQRSRLTCLPLKDIAWSWFEHLNARRIDAAMAMLDDDGSW
jgi:hypothetical protein